MWEDEGRAVTFDLIVNPYAVPIGIRPNDVLASRSGRTARKELRLSQTTLSWQPFPRNQQVTVPCDDAGAGGCTHKLDPEALIRALHSERCHPRGFAGSGLNGERCTKFSRVLGK